MSIKGLPDPLAPFEEKITEEYGKKIAWLISNEWFNGGFISDGCNYGRRRDYVRKKRLFVRAESDNAYFKEQMSKSDNDLDYINLDWQQINWAEKFARTVSNSIGDEHYKIKVTSMDSLSEIKRKNKAQFYRKQINGRDIISGFQQSLGVDISPGIEIPEIEEDIDLFMEIKDRPKIEIAEELLIDFVKKTNGWDVIEAQKNKDITDVGLICARVWIDKNDGVKVEYIDPEYYIHSEVRKFDFSDKTYDGYVTKLTLGDIKRESGFDNETMKKIAKDCGYNFFSWTESTGWPDLLRQEVDVCRFAYKTFKTIKYKTKKRNGRLVKANLRNDLPDVKGESFDVVSKTLDTWLEGTFIIGTQHLYGYQECENLFDDIMNKSVSPYIAFAYDIYKNKLRSFLDNIEAPARQLQKIHLKIQHLISELSPDLKEIDLDLLAELDDGKGGAKKEVWQTALELMQVKGVVFKKRINMGEDGMKDEAAVRVYAQNQGSALVHLFNAWAHYYNMIRENTGINPARDGTMPGYSLVGTNQIAQMASNIVTKNIVDCALLFTKRVAEVISTRIHTIFNYKEGKDIQELYSNVVSKQLLDAVELLKDRNLHEFGFIIEMRPTEEELTEFGEMLSMAVSDGSIDVEVASEARALSKSNIKLAQRYLLYERKKRIKQRQEEEMMLSENKSKNDAMAAQARVQAEGELYQNKKQIDLWFEREKAQIDIIKKRAEAELKDAERSRAFDEKLYFAQLNQIGMNNREQMREDRKDARTEKQASQQSQLIEQRQGGSGAVDFTADSVEKTQGTEISTL